MLQKKKPASASTTKSLNGFRQRKCTFRRICLNKSICHDILRWLKIVYNISLYLTLRRVSINQIHMINIKTSLFIHQSSAVLYFILIKLNGSYFLLRIIFTNFDINTSIRVFFSRKTFHKYNFIFEILCHNCHHYYTIARDCLFDRYTKMH